MPIFTTVNDIGIKEDVSDIISNISPTKTPFISSIGTKKAHNTTVSWLTDALDAPASNVQPEGFTAVAQTLAPVSILSNVTQIFAKVIEVSGTDDAVELHGRDKQSAYQMAKQGAAIKRDLELACLNSQVQSVSGITRTMASAQAQVPAGGVTKTGGTSTPLTEANLLAALSYCYANGAEPETILVTPNDSIVIAAFAQAAGRYRTFNDDQKTLTNVVNLYVSPVGQVKVVLDRFLAASDTLVYDPEMFKLHVLRPWFREQLAKTGDSLRQMIVGEYSLEHTNPLATAIIRKSA